MAVSTGKASRPSKVVKPKRNSRKTTESTRNFSFKSFNDRITTLKVDPIRRKRDNEEREELADERATYFGRSLTRWRDINLSRVLTSFAAKAGPLADNLPLLLHNQERIFELLVEHIQEGDVLSLEPLLMVLADFAHDLDVRFETFFQTAVKTVSAVAAKHHDSAVIEWCFNCLAWLFKYLSRLLAPDLRPVYDLMAPYLGKTQQKHYIVRFAAESMSFLVRKAAVSFERNRDPLETIIRHMLQDLESSQDNANIELYRQGVMVLLTDAVRGVQQALHTAGPAILQTVFDQAKSTQSIQAYQVVQGILTSLIHASTSTTFAPVLGILLDVSENIEGTADIKFAAQSLFVAMSVRKGTRISNWTRVIEVLSSIVKAAQSSSNASLDERWTAASAVAICVLYCADTIKLLRSSMLDDVAQPLWTREYIRICEYVSRIDPGRFNSLLRDKLRALTKALEPSSDQLMFMLSIVPHLQITNATRLPLSEDVQARLVTVIQSTVQNGSIMPETYADANVVLEALPYIELSSERKVVLDRMLSGVLDLYAGREAADLESSTDHRIIFGPVLASWMNITSSKEKYPAILANASRYVASHLYSLRSFWINVTGLLSAIAEGDLQQDTVQGLLDSATQALCLDDRQLRQTVLDVLQSVFQKLNKEIPEALSIAILIESVPLNMENSRAISMNIRRLVPAFDLVKDDKTMACSIATYCLGLLHFRLSQIWGDAIEVLGEFCKSTLGEQAVMQVVQMWLLQAPEDNIPEGEVQLITANEPHYLVKSDFECPTLTRMKAISAQVFGDQYSGRPSPSARLEAITTSIAIISSDARSQALRLLDKLPHIAEKRSRLIVPTLLNWAGDETGAADDITVNRWNRKDQKAMLNIFAQFGNPKVLFEADKVHDALLNLCKNGDVDIQKAALKALLSWKTPELLRYQEHLQALLDDASFREELSVFLQGDEEDGIQEADLPVVMPVLLRLLYGRLVGGSKEGQQAKRRAVFVALSTFSASILSTFVDITLAGCRDIKFTENGQFSQQAAIDLTMPLRQQVGMLNMLGDFIETLGSALQPFGSLLLHNIMGCTIVASRKLLGMDEGAADQSQLRAVRLNGLQAMHKLFTVIDDDSLSSMCQIITEEIILYRFDRFVAENSQGISATLRLIAAWSASESYAHHLSAAGSSILNTLADLFVASATKDETRLFTLDKIFTPLLGHQEASIVPGDVIGRLARSMASVLSQQPERHLLESCVNILQLLASRIQASEQTEAVLEACRVLLTQSSLVVPVQTKLGLLRTMMALLDHPDTSASPGLYNAVCGMFSRLHDSSSRALLSDVFKKLASKSDHTVEVARICQGLNKLDDARLGQVDYEQREQAFVMIYEHAHLWVFDQWMPVLHNCLHFIRDEEDTVNRASAAKVLQMLVTASAKDIGLSNLVHVDLFAAIQRGMTSKSEFVRAEFLNLLHSIVLQHSEWKEVTDLRGLAVDGDIDESFFTNVLHIQQHKRLKALRFLGEDSKVSSKNIVRIFLPLLEVFIFDQAEGDAGRTLADQAVQTIGSLAKQLKWSDMRKTLLRYYGYLKTKEDLEKTVLRMIGALVDGLTAALGVKASTDDGADTEDDAITMLPQERINVILKDYLPPLQDFLHQKDESKVDRRVAVAISVVKLARLLPEDQFSAKLAPTLTDIAHILRSRDLEAREQTRRTLSTILGIIGPNCLQYILKELRGALQRGYQLHVMSYTVHHLLVTNGADFKPGDIDECVPLLTSIILDDIFGVTGQEKDAEEYKSGMKEVKSSKSFDTMEIVARMTSITSLGQLVLPIRALLQERLDSKIVKKIDELLLRVRRGIDQNPSADTRDMLVFCHEIVRQAYDEKTQSHLEDWKLKKYVQQSRKAPGGAMKGSTTSYLFKLKAFAFGLLRKVLRRHEDLQTPANLAGFLPMIGDGLVAGESDVKIESAKLLSTILAVELPEIDAGTAVYLKEAIAMVKGSHSTINESARAGLELATAVLRERRDAVLKDKDVSILLKAIKADIDEPDRQGQTFRFLRAVLGRKIVIPEVYEIMDEVARIMVNNSDDGVRQSARAAYIQFIIDFPQGKARWDKTTAFLVKNLAFEHASGRRSVMEVIHTLLGRLGQDVLQEILLGLFIGLTQRVISDEDAACREMASVLVSRVLEKTDAELLEKIKTLVSKWLQNDKDSIKQAAIVSWTIILRAGQADTKNVNLLVVTLSELVADNDVEQTEALSIAGLELLIALCETTPERAFAKDTMPIWTGIVQAIKSSTPERQIISSRAVTLLFNDVASTTAKQGAGLKSAKLETSAGLLLKSEFWFESCMAHLQCLRNSSPDQKDLLDNISRNITFHARVFAANGTQWRQQDTESSSDEESDGENDTRERSALGYVMSRLIYTTRREGISPVTRLAALQTAATIVQAVDVALPNIKPLVRALYVLTDATASRQAGEDYKVLADRARETLDLLQSKVGSQKYIELLAQARKDVIEKRDDRRQKRRIEAVSQPERWAKEKRRRNDAQKVRAKAKSEMHRSQRRGW